MNFAAGIGQGISDAFKAIDSVTMNASSGTFTVNKDNVLAAGKIIESHVEALHDTCRDSIRDLRIDPPGTDDVSVRMARAWNDLLLGDDDSFRERVMDYLYSLKKLTVQLADSAKAYGYTEDEITAAFGWSDA